MQHTFNKQLTQRYRNNRRRSSKAKSLKMVLTDVEARVTSAKENLSPRLQDEDDDENTEAL